MPLHEGEPPSRDGEAVNGTAALKDKLRGVDNQKWHRRDNSVGKEWPGYAGYVAIAPTTPEEGKDMAHALGWQRDQLGFKPDQVGGGTSHVFEMTAAKLAEMEKEWGYARPDAAAGGTNFEGLFAYSEGDMKDHVFFIKPESKNDADGTPEVRNEVRMRCGKPIPSVEKSRELGGKYRPWVPATKLAAEQTAKRFRAGSAATSDLGRQSTGGGNADSLELGNKARGQPFEQPTSQIKGLYAYTKGSFKGIYFGANGSFNEMCEPVPKHLWQSEGACRFPHLLPKPEDKGGANETVARFAFAEAVVENADYQGPGGFEDQVKDRDWFTKEADAKIACCENPKAKGYWRRKLPYDSEKKWEADPDDPKWDDPQLGVRDRRDGYYLLVHKDDMHGSCTWSKGRKGRSWNPFKENDSVMWVKKQSLVEDHVWLPLDKDNQPLLGWEIDANDGLGKPCCLTGVTEDEQQCGRRLMLQAEPFPKGRELRDTLEQFQRAPEKLRPKGARKLQFWVLVVGNGLFNVFTIIKRFLDRPEYEPEIPYNTTRRLLAMIEMGYVCLWGFFLFVVFPLRTLWAVRRHKYWEPEVQYPPDGTTVVDKSKGVWKDGLTDRTRAEGVVEFTELLQALLSINLLKGLLGLKPYLTRVPKNFANLRHAYPRAKEAKAKKQDSQQAGEDGFDDRLEKALTSYYLREFIRDMIDAPLYIGAPLALMVKLAQVSFLGVPPGDWTGNQWLDALSFLNTVMSLDNSARVSLETLYDFMFTGETCEHNESNDNAKELYHTVITARLIQDVGYLDTVVALMMPDAKTFQSLLIKEFQLQVQPKSDSETPKLSPLPSCKQGLLTHMRTGNEPELAIPGPYKWFTENFALESTLVPTFTTDKSGLRWKTSEALPPTRTLAAGPARKFAGEKFRLEMSAGPHMVNDKIQVTFMGATNEKDWVGIYNKGAEVGKDPSAIWQYVKKLGQGTVELTVPKPGQYFLVMLDASSIPQAIEEVGYTERTERLSIEVHGAYQPAELISSPLSSAGEGGFAEIPFVDWESMWRDYEPTKKRLEDYYRENGDEKFPFEMNLARFKKLVVRGMEQENSFGKFNFTLDLEALQKSSDQAAHAAKAAAEAAAAAPEDKKAAAEATATAAATEAEAKTEELKKFKNLLKGIGWKGVDNRKWTVRRTGTDPIWSKPRKVHLFGSERAKIKPLNKKECLLAPSSCCLQPALRYDRQFDGTYRIIKSRSSGLIGVRPKYTIDRPAPDPRSDRRLLFNGHESHFCWDRDQDKSVWDPQKNLWQGSIAGMAEEGNAPLATSEKAVVYWEAVVTSNMDEAVWNPGGAAVGIGIPEFASNEYGSGIKSGNGFFGWDSWSGRGYVDGNFVNGDVVDGNLNCQQRVQCEGKEWRTHEWHPVSGHKDIFSSLIVTGGPDQASSLFKQRSKIEETLADIPLERAEERRSELEKLRQVYQQEPGLLLPGQYDIDIRQFGNTRENHHGKPTLTRTKCNGSSTLDDTQLITIEFIAKCPEKICPDFADKAVWVFKYTDGTKKYDEKNRERYLCGALAELSNGYGVPVPSLLNKSRERVAQKLQKDREKQMHKWRPFEDGFQIDGLLIKKGCDDKVVDNAIFRLQPGRLSMLCGSKSNNERKRYFKWVVDLPEHVANSTYQPSAYICGAGIKVTLKQVQHGSLFDALKNSDGAMLKRSKLRAGSVGDTEPKEKEVTESVGDTEPKEKEVTESGGDTEPKEKEVTESGGDTEPEPEPELDLELGARP